LWLIAGVKIRGSGEVKCYVPLKGGFVPMNIEGIKKVLHIVQDFYKRMLNVKY